MKKKKKNGKKKKKENKYGRISNRRQVIFML